MGFPRKWSWSRGEIGSGDGLVVLQDRLASWLLGWPLTTFLSVLCLYMLATWIPHYVTWPWYCDHDHFAQLAQLWDSGRAYPYRDFFSFQFPGELYVFWAFGKVFGWGNSVAFYSFDAILVAGFGVILALWSRRLFGQIAPGLIGYSFFLFYYLDLDYRLAAQRDWHAAFFGLLGLLLPGIVSGRPGRIGSGVAFGISLIFRPQMVLLLPALVVALDRSARPGGGPAGKSLLALLEWAAGALGTVIVGFLPLAAEGLISDLLRNLNLAVSSAYSGNDIFGSANPLFELPRLSAFVFFPLLAGLLFPWHHARLVPPACETALAVGGIAFYKMISPVYFPYHEIPQIATVSLAVVFLAGMIRATRLSARVQIAIMLLLFMFSMPQCPRFALVKLEPATWKSYGVLEAFRLIPTGKLPMLVPPGFADRTKYPWYDVRDMLEYLRSTTSPATPVANMLFDSVSAVNGPLPRLSPLPLDNKLLYSFPDRGDLVARILTVSENCVVVWRPSDYLWLSARYQSMKRVIEEQYQAEAHFGVIEVRRHVPRETLSPSPAPGSRSSTSVSRPSRPPVRLIGSATS